MARKGSFSFRPNTRNRTAIEWFLIYFLSLAGTTKWQMHAGIFIKYTVCAIFRFCKLNSELWCATDKAQKYSRPRNSKTPIVLLDFPPSYSYPSDADLKATLKPRIPPTPSQSSNWFCGFVVRWLSGSQLHFIVFDLPIYRF